MATRSTLTVANARPHDLFFFAEPKEMLAGHVASPGVFLEAPAVLERQFTAYCFDRWVESGIPRTAIPGRVSTVLEHLDPADPRHFPHSLLAFIEVERTGLYDRFLQIFDLRPESFAARHIDRFVRGGEDGRSGLRLRVVEGFHRLHKERRSLENNVKLLRTRIKKKEAEPAKDKNHAREVAELKREKGALQRLAADLGKTGVFEFLSDEGLLPNYAFPEAGVVLKSIIYRKREAPDKDGSSYDNWVYEYERPGSSAISELAPENYFYAEGRKVAARPPSTVYQVACEVDPAFVEHVACQSFHLDEHRTLLELFHQKDHAKTHPHLVRGLFDELEERSCIVCSMLA